MAAVTVESGYPITIPLGNNGYVKSLYKLENGSVDDDSTLDTGLAKIISLSWCSTVDGSDFAVDNISSAGVLTFGSSANNGGYLEIIHTSVLA